MGRWRMKGWRTVHSTKSKHFNHISALLPPLTLVSRPLSQHKNGFLPCWRHGCVLAGSTVVFSERECSDCFFFCFLSFFMTIFFSLPQISTWSAWAGPQVQSVLTIPLSRQGKFGKLTLLKMTLSSCSKFIKYSSQSRWRHKKNHSNQQVDHYLSGNAAEAVRKPQSASRSVLV